jgi:Flp pilus assembly protein TadG
MRQAGFRFSLSPFLRRFARAEGGGVALIFGLTILPLLLATGAAVDYRRATEVRTRLQKAADSAALAAVDALRRGADPEAAATNYVDQRVAGTNLTTTNATLQRGPATITVRVRTRLPTAFMKLARIDEIPISVEATAAVGAGNQPVDLAIVIDTTESMAQQGRLAAAKTAAKDLIDTIMLQPDGSTNRAVRVGLVPFAKYVNIGTQYQREPWLNAPAWLRTSLTHDRCPDTCLEHDLEPIHRPRTCYDNDATARNCDVDVVVWKNCRRWGPPTQCFQSEWKGCVASEFSPDDESDRPRDIRPLVIEDADSWFPYDLRCPRPLTRLSRDVVALKQSVDALTPEGETYIAPGLLWGWRLLSTNPPFADGSVNPATKKFIVLMTDGANTHSPYLGYDETVHEGTNVAYANEKLLKICTNIKNAGIRLYTIAFKIADPTTQSLLRRCVAADSNYFDAQTNTQLLQAFSAIGSQITTLRLIR